MQVTAANTHPFHQGGATLVIATSQPALLAAAESRRESIFKVTSSSQEAFDFLRTAKNAALLADFDELDDHWTGQRMLRHIRLSPDLAHVPVYLMADSWPDAQAVWSTRLGAVGLIERSAAAVGAFVMGRAPRLSNALKQSLAQIDELFTRYAGPLTATHLADARLALESQSIELGVDAYADFLIERLGNESARKGFQRQVKVVLASRLATDSVPDNVIASLRDPWVVAVDEVFTQQVGKLVAKSTLPGVHKGLASLIKSSKASRHGYIDLLAETVGDSDKRAEFLLASRDTASTLPAAQTGN